MILGILSLLLQFALVPASPAEQRADLSLRRAAEGRTLATRFLCGDDRRLQRLRDLDDTFASLQTSFARIFSHPWQTDPGASVELDRDVRAEVGRKDDCRLSDSFAAGLTDYENGLFAARAELGVSG